MVVIKKEDIAPQGEWRYIDPDTGTPLQHASLMQLRLKMEALREANGLQALGDDEFKSIVCTYTQCECYHTMGAGDLVAFVAQPIAKAIDTLAAAVGVNTDVSGCGGCKKRKEKLNDLTQRMARRLARKEKT